MLKRITEFLLQEWKFFVILSVLVAALGIAYYEYRQYAKTTQVPPGAAVPSITVNTGGQPSKPGETQVVYLKGENTHTKEIVYVPKETIETKQPDGTIKKEQEKTDVEIERKQGVVFVKVNGKEFAVPAEVKEESKFENGKLVVTEQSEMRINITAPKPALNLGVGWSKDGPAVQMNGPFFKNVSWWVYGDKKKAAGGIQFPISK